MTPTENASPTPANMVQALQDLGEDWKLPGKQNRARVFLQTIPIDTLIAVVPALWQQTDRKRQRLLRQRLPWLVLPLLVWLAVGLFLCSQKIAPATAQRNSDTTMMMTMLGAVLSLPMHALSLHLARLDPVHKGMVRLAHLRPCWQFVPLLIDSSPFTLQAVEGTPDARNVAQRHRVLLTKYLPLWCAEDTDDLTLRQRKILLGEVKRIARAGTGWHRNIDGPTPPLSEADADFVIAALNTLCRPSRHADTASTLDPPTRTVLKRLPHAIGAEDVSRQHLQEAAQVLLSRGRI